MTQRPITFYEAYIFDLDGTVYLGDALLPNAQRAVTTIRNAGKRTVFLSNNPTHTRFEYSRKLTRLGLPTPRVDIVNSSVVLVDFLQHTLPGARLFVCGEQPLIDDLRDGGFLFTILNLLQLPPDRCIMTGDRLETDVQLGLTAGMVAALTLTGATTLEDAHASPLKPHFILNDLGDLLPETSHET